ncbi:MAG: hypothetical protein IKH27_03000 [Oscillospiraceae bacterium]|nr:hypothetical protein [Oscillospiraceae bacterium]
MPKKKSSEMFIRDSDGFYFVRNGRVYHDNRGHLSIWKRFQSDAEAEAFLLRMVQDGQSSCKRKPDAEMNEKHKKSHRLKRPK